jgi:hypothetical protein
MVLFGLVIPSLIEAQPYSIDWYEVADGGTSTSGVYSVSGKIDQPDASTTPLLGGSCSLAGGFWSLLPAGQTSKRQRWTFCGGSGSVCPIPV